MQHAEKVNPKVFCSAPDKVYLRTEYTDITISLFAHMYHPLGWGEIFKIQSCGSAVLQGNI